MPAPGEEGKWMKAFRKDPHVYRSLDRGLGASSDKNRYVPSTYGSLWHKKALKSSLLEVERINKAFEIKVIY